MRTLIRWLMRNILLLMDEEWENAQQEMREMQAVHKIRVLCNTELQIMRVELAGIEQLEREAQRAIQRNPAAESLIEEIQQERMQQLIYVVREQAAQKRLAA